MSDVDNAFAAVARMIEGIGVVVTAIGVIVVLARSAPGSNWAGRGRGAGPPP